MDPKGWRLLERVQQASKRVTPGGAVLLRQRGRGNSAAETSGPVPNIDLANVGVGRARRSYRAERESGIPRPTLAPHDDCDGRDRYRHMQKRYGNRQNMMAVFVSLAIPQLFLGFTLKRLTFGEKLPFVHAVSLRLFFEVAGRRPRVCRGDSVKMLLDTLCLIEIPRVGCFVLQEHRGVLVAYGIGGFERLETADGRGDDSKDRYRDRYLREKWIAQKSGTLGVLEALNWRFGHEPTPRAGKVGLYRGTRIMAIEADDGRAVGSRGCRQ